MKKFYSTLCAIVLAGGLSLGMVGCASNSNSDTKSDSNTQTEESKTINVEEKSMEYITPEDASAKLSDSNTLFIDVRKAEDFNKSSIPGTINADMDKAKDGDNQSGIDAITALNLDSKGGKDIILVCYSGKRYAQAATNILNYVGYDMSKVKTLEGGMKAWEAAGLSVETK